MFDPLVGKNSLEEGVETYSSILASVHSGQRAAVYGVTKCQTELKQLSMYARYVLSAQRDELAPSLVEERG